MAKKKLRLDEEEFNHLKKNIKCVICGNQLTEEEIGFHSNIDNYMWCEPCNRIHNVHANDYDYETTRKSTLFKGTMGK